MCHYPPPLQPPTTKEGAPSDHVIAVVTLTLPGSTVRRKKYIKRRKYDRARATAFIEHMTSVDWSFLENDSVHYMAKRFQLYLDEQYDVFFPWEQIEIREGDPVYFNKKLQNHHKKVQRLYRRRGQRSRYNEEKRKFRREMKKASKNFYL